MSKQIHNKIFGNIKFTLSLIIAFLVLDKLFEAIGTSTFFGVNFQIIPWVILIFAVISFISDLKDVEWIKRRLNKIFK
jgi:uncharacterized membrane protein YozB (DUF420 family)